MAKAITEKTIVSHIVTNWTNLFEEELIFYRTEISWLDNWRCDITAYIHMMLGEEYGYEKPHNFRAPIFIEVKYDSDSRDLIYELTKALSYSRRLKLPSYVGVISNDFSDPYILGFLQDNGIHMWKIEMENQILDTLKLTYIEPTQLEVLDTVD